MWSEENDVVLSAAAYYMENIRNKSLPHQQFKSNSTPPQFQLTSGDSISKSCGTIFITINHFLIFHCTFCNTKYGTLYQFLQHISAAHLHLKDEINKSEIKQTEFASHSKLESEMHYSVKSISQTSNEQQPKSIDIVKQDIVNALGDDEDVVDFSAKARYKRLLHRDEAVETSKDKNPLKKRKTYKKRNKIEVLLKCDKCGRSFKSKAVLKDHLISHSSARNYSCTICDRTYKHKCNLNQHILRHTQEKKYQCEQCHKLFFTKNEAERHQLWHNTDRSHVCFKCGDAFKSGCNLLQHIRRVHDHIRSAKCHVCDMSFFDNTMLKAHMLIHTNVRNFACSYCPAKFKRRHHLTQHNKTHSSAKEYKCDICNKSFNLRPALSSHIKNSHKVI